MIMKCYIGDRSSKNVAGESGVAADKLRAAIAEAEEEL